MPARAIDAAARSSSSQTPGPVPAKFEVQSRSKVNVKEASDVVALPNGGFMVVGDRSDRVGVIDGEGKFRKLRLPGVPDGKSGLEGAAYDPARHHLFVAREETGEILRYEWNPAKKTPPRLEKTFKVGSDANKGVEGLAYLPGQFSPTGKPQLLAVKEGKPRDLYCYDDGGGGKPLLIKLEDQVRAVCKDFSGVAVDPITGHLFISSDESSTVAQVVLVRRGNKLEGRLVQSFPLRDDKNEPLQRVEGLTFNAKGDLFVLTENDGMLHRLDRRQ